MGHARVIEPGSVVWVNLDPSVGREQGRRRPAVVVSSAGHLAAATTIVTVVPVTTTDRKWPNHIELTGPHGLAQPSWAMTEQVRTISRERIAAERGHVDPACLRAIGQWLRRWLV